MNTANIKDLGKPVAYRYKRLNIVEWVMPVHMKSGGFTAFILSPDVDQYNYLPPEYAGPFSTEQEAVEAGLKYMPIREAEVTNG